MFDVTFNNPWVLWVLLLLPAFWVWYILRQSYRKVPLVLPTLSLFEPKGSNKIYYYHITFILKTIVLGLLMVALARPQSSSSSQSVKVQGIDIMLAIDISGSMLARDLRPNRLEAAKRVAADFIDKRNSDRIGLVVYAGESFTQSPLTTDHSVIKNLLGDLQNGLIEDGTAIGMGLATAVNRLKDSKAESKVVILLTDGSNNSGEIPPLTAAEIARTFGVKVYTIGVGTNGMAPMPMRYPDGRIVYERQKVFIDEETLEGIAQQTNGQYFRATDNESLADIYAKIDQLEKTEIDVKEYRKKTEEFYPWVLTAAALLVLTYFIRQLVFKSVSLN
jgi:Ca-activated chloride channel family protein